MKIGFTCGAFDLLHAGHVVMLKEARANCDQLIVGLQTDPSIDRQTKNAPVQNVYERFIQLSSLQYVDDVIPYDTEESLMDLIQSTEFHLRFVGEDYIDRDFTGKGLHEIYYTDRKHSFSTSDMRGKLGYVKE